MELRWTNTSWAKVRPGEVWSLLTSITGDMRKEAVTSRAAITINVKAPLVGKCGGGAVLFKNLCKLVDW